MKKLFILVMLCLPHLFGTCEKKNQKEEVVAQKDTTLLEMEKSELLGKWQAVETWFDIGNGDVTTKKVEDPNDFYTFLADGTFTTTVSDCDSKGTNKLSYTGKLVADRNEFLVPSLSNW